MTTQDARQAKIDALHAQLETAVSELTTSDNWQAWLAMAAKFHRYSLNNQLLIALQCPEATHVAGYRAWQGMGRQVRKGSKAITILAPSTRKIVDPMTGEEERRVIGYRGVAVFDVSQTDGEPLPVRDAPVAVAGDAPVGLWDALAGIATANGYSVERGDTGRAHGWTQPATRTIRVSDSLSDAHSVKTLAHELAHMILHADDAYDYSAHRGIAETEAESVAYIVAAAHGIPTDEYSVPYVAGWGEDAEAVRKTATAVVKTARKILDVTLPDGE